MILLVTLCVAAHTVYSPKAVLGGQRSKATAAPHSPQPAVLLVHACLPAPLQYHVNPEHAKHHAAVDGKDVNDLSNDGCLSVEDTPDLPRVNPDKP